MPKRKAKILIVDDAQINRIILCELLRNQYQILEAEDGKKALEMIKEDKSIDLVLLDIVMPNMDGYQVLEKMKEQRYLEYLPVIIISSEGDTTSMEKAYELGATDYIRRPFESYIINRRIKNTLMLYEKQNHRLRSERSQNRCGEHEHDIFDGQSGSYALLRHPVGVDRPQSGQSAQTFRRRRIETTGRHDRTLRSDTTRTGTSCPERTDGSYAFYAGSWGTADTGVHHCRQGYDTCLYQRNACRQDRSTCLTRKPASGRYFGIRTGDGLSQNGLRRRKRDRSCGR